MKKKMMVIMSLLVTSCIIFVFLFYRTNEIEYSFVAELELVDSLHQIDHDFSFVTFKNEIELESLKSIKPIIFYSDKISKIPFDFKKYNYLISFGREVKSISYSWDFVLFKTTWYYSEFGKSIPVRVFYKTKETTMSIYIYQLPKKIYYRNEIG